MIVPFPIPKGTSLAVSKRILTRTVYDLFDGKPACDLILAIGAGHRALERHEPFMDAVAVAEGVFKLWDDVKDLEHSQENDQRNRMRMIAYRVKVAALLEL